MPLTRLARPAALPASLTGLALSALLMSGCYAPGGGINPVTGGAQTLFSTASAVKTFHLIDHRTGETVFSMEIPVGKQLTYQFTPDRGDDPVRRPDLMRYQLFDIGKTSGRLRSAVSVPDQHSRIVTWDVTSGQFFEEPPPNVRYRTDPPGERPAWWSPEGGPMPDNSASRIYDG